jgi:methylmalonyl-CoA epimerase
MIPVGRPFRIAVADGTFVRFESSRRRPMEQLKSVLPEGLGIEKIDHVAVVVRDMDTALGLYRDKLGLPVDAVMDMEYDHVLIGFLSLGGIKIELVQPTDDTTGVARFLESKGEGFHHICFEVPDIQAALDKLAAGGLQLIDTEARKGGEGPVAFIHPKSCHGVLVELIEAHGGPAWTKLGY